MLESLKKQDPKMLMIYAILLIVAIITLFVSFGGDDDNNNADMTELSIEEKNSTYDSKLSAYNAKLKDERESISHAYNYDMSAYLEGNANQEDSSSVYETDDEDIRRLQDMLRNESQTNSYVSPTISNAVTPKPIKESTIIEKVEEEVKVEEEIEAPKSRFFRSGKKQEVGNSIPCVVHGNQTISDASPLKMRVLEDIMTEEGVILPKNIYVNGIARLNAKEGRMRIELKTVSYRNNIYTIKGTIYDRDGIEGINIPPSLKAKIASQASSSIIQDADVQSENKGILSSAANAVTTATKNVLSKDKQEIKFEVKSNHKLLLK